MWLTRLALRNPVLILMASLMVCVLGYVSLTHLGVDLFPNIDIPVIRIATFYPGAGPEDIEKSITQPIERAVSSSPGIDRVESTSKQGLSAINVWFQYGTNLDNAQFDVSQRIAQVLSSLPPGVQQPFVLKFDITNLPVAMVVLTADDLDERQLYDLGYNVVEPQLERIPGVASATLSGGRTREVTVMAQRDALRTRGLGILDLVGAVRASNLLLPSGNLRAGDRDYNVFSNNEVGKVRELEDVVVRTGSVGSSGLPSPVVRVSDVATVVDGVADKTEIVRINGKPGVVFRVLKQPGANTIAVVDALTKTMGSLRGVPPNVKVELSFDQSRYIRAAVSALQHEAVQGGILAVLVILLFLASFRATGIIAVAIPLSIVATFVLLYFSGQTLNVFTLGGLALGVGRLVDDSIVELENIHRHFVVSSDRKTAVLAAAQEVAAPIFVSTLTTVIVFFPVLFLTGVAKNLFVPLALTITFALFLSFLVSRTVTPLLCLSMLKTGEPTGILGAVSRSLDKISDAYAVALAWALRHRAVVIVGTLGLFAASLTLVKKIGSEFFPDSDEAQFTVVYKRPVGTRVDRTVETGNQLEAAVIKELGKDFTVQIDQAGIPAGRAGLFSPNTGPHAGTLSVNLVPKTARSFSDVEATEKVRKAMRDAMPGVQAFYSNGGMVKRILNMGSSAPIDVEILGYDLDEGGAYAKQVLNRLRALNDEDGQPLLSDLQITREENYPELDVHVDRQKAGVLGLSEQQVAQSVLTTLSGNNQFAPVLYTDPGTGNIYNVNVRMDDRYRSQVSDLSDIFLRAPSGAMVSLDTVASVERGSGPVQINRKYLQRIIDVTANVAPGKDLGRASAATQKVLDELLPPEGFTVNLGGQTKAQKDAFSGLIFAAVMALALVYMVLASQFKSLLDPLVIMFSVPMGLSGVFAALLLTKTTLSVNSFMGIIMMVGIVVSNGVLLVDFANTLRARGKPLFEATVEAGRTRLRPILMTTIATIVGLFPMALGVGEGSETNLPLARAVIGGLTVSTFFTLFLIPSLYTLLERFTKREVEDPAAADVGGAHE
ncbi:MAG: efflux RND transporter permease subunit [Myxococcales bacterium]